MSSEERRRKREERKKWLAEKEESLAQGASNEKEEEGDDGSFSDSSCDSNSSEEEEEEVEEEVEVEGEGGRPPIKVAVAASSSAAAGGLSRLARLRGGGGASKLTRQHQTMLDMKTHMAHRRWLGADDDTRIMQDVTPLETTELSSAILFGLNESGQSVQINVLKKHLEREGRLSTECVLELCEKVSAVLRQESNVLELKAPLKVVGDLHGQFYDLLNLFEVCGSLESGARYLFLGDYVDRGMFGCETVIYLLALKLRYPEQIWLLRGNHESREITEYFNFQEECYIKYNGDVYDQIMDTFDTLPLAALLTCPYGRFLCTHGGLGPGINTLDDIRACDRFREPPESGVFCDLLWSDPIDIEEYPHMTDEEHDTFDFLPNDARGVGWVYGKTALRRFLAANDLVCLVRAHEVQQYGYTEHRFGERNLEHPLAITVFSAPNYCDMYENRAGIINFDEDKYSFTQTAWVDHPYWLPDFMNAFSFSLPYVADNVANIVLTLLMTMIGNDDSSDDEHDEADDEVWQSIKAKLDAARKAMPELEQSRKQRADMVLPKVPVIKDSKHKFREIKQFDRKNERRPRRRHVAMLRRAKSAKW